MVISMVDFVKAVVGSLCLACVRFSNVGIIATSATCERLPSLLSSNLHVYEVAVNVRLIGIVQP
jgi:hypothetical protein